MQFRYRKEILVSTQLYYQLLFNVFIFFLSMKVPEMNLFRGGSRRLDVDVAFEQCSTVSDAHAYERRRQSSFHR